MSFYLIMYYLYQSNMSLVLSSLDDQMAAHWDRENKGNYGIILLIDN